MSNFNWSTRTNLNAENCFLVSHILPFTTDPRFNLRLLDTSVMQMKNHDNNYDSRIRPVIRKIVHEAQNDKMVRGITLVTRSSAYIHGTIWSFSSRELDSLFWIFICFDQTIYSKKSVGEGENICFSWNYILLFSVCLTLMVPSKSMKRNKAIYKKKKQQNCMSLFSGLYLQD